MEVTKSFIKVGTNSAILQQTNFTDIICTNSQSLFKKDGYVSIQFDTTFSALDNFSGTGNEH